MGFWMKKYLIDKLDQCHCFIDKEIKARETFPST